LAKLFTVEHAAQSTAPPLTRWPGGTGFAEWQIKARAHAEAAVFFDLVRRGIVSKDQAKEDLGVEPQIRALLEAFARQSPPYTARAVQQALRLRELALAEFEKLAARSTPNEPTALRPAA